MVNKKNHIMYAPAAKPLLMSSKREMKKNATKKMKNNTEGTHNNTLSQTPNNTSLVDGPPSSPGVSPQTPSWLSRTWLLAHI